jgi:hypothetical protein
MCKRQVAEGREWHAAMERALSHWSDRALYAAFAQWLLYVQVMMLITCTAPDTPRK